MATGSQQSSSKGTSLRETYSERFQRLKERRELLHRKHIKKKGKREKTGKAKSSDGEERKEINQEIHISTPSTGNSDSQLTLTELQSHIASDPYKQPFCISGSDKALLSIDEAIEDGNYDRAAQLSDKLSDQRLACEIAAAFDKHRRIQKDSKKKTKKKTKLKWKFEHKKRWEMKGNM